MSRTRILPVPSFVLVCCLGLLATLGGCGQQDAAQATPASAVEAFFQQHIKAAPQAAGLPTQEQLSAMAPYLSRELRWLLEQAASRHPKPARPAKASKKNRPFVEGDIFTSLADGATSFNIADAGAVEALSPYEHIVPVRLWSARQTPAFNWVDRVKVVYEDGRYVIADIQYQNHWSFGAGASLAEILKKDNQGREARKLARAKQGSATPRAVLADT